MGAAVRKLQGEPIAIVTLALPIDRYPRGLGLIHRLLDRLAAGERVPIYAIFDMRAPEPSFSDILLWLAEQSSDVSGSICDPRVCPVIVGTRPIISIAVKKAQQRLGVDLIQFPSLDEALCFARSTTVQRVIS